MLIGGFARLTWRTRVDRLGLAPAVGFARAPLDALKYSYARNLRWISSCVIVTIGTIREYLP